MNLPQSVRCPIGRLVRSERVLLAACVLLVPSAVHAVAYACVGKVSQVTTDPGGNVNATFTFTTGVMAWQQVCNLNASGTDNVGTSACKGILTTLLSAKLTQADVMMWFDNSTGGSCSNTSWTSLRGAGWYWGPSIQ